MLGRMLALPSGNALDRARALRKVLLDAIELLRPGDNIPPTEPEWRPYMVLLQRYTQHQPPLVICSDLGISDRQYQREHSRGLQALVSILQATEAFAGPGETQLSANGSIAAEAEILLSSQRREPLDLSQILNGVVESVGQLAYDHEVKIRVSPNPGGGPIYGDRGLVRQILFNIIGELMSIASGKSLLVEQSLGPACRSVSISFTEDLSNQVLESSSRLTLARELAEAVRGTILHEDGVIHLHLPIARPALLVIDDNDDLIGLLSRYLVGEDVEVVSTACAGEALRLARELEPQLILLDVMMPSHDGWELLQMLRHHPDSQNIPVVICSILREPELASSLGAEGYLAKPVSQDDLVGLVRRYF